MKNAILYWRICSMKMVCKLSEDGFESGRKQKLLI